MNILCVGAHPDDIELMAGGSILYWLDVGHNVHGLNFTDGVWYSPNGKRMRTTEEAIIEQSDAAKILNYKVENLLQPAMDLQFSDSLVVELLKRINEYNIDTIICPWNNDQHHDHEIVNRIAMAASKRIPRVMMGQINYYLRDFFSPNIFVDITDHFDKKIEALQAYENQWGRAGDDWYEFLDITSLYYGKMVGVKRAEGFMTNKYLIPQLVD